MKFRSCWVGLWRRFLSMIDWKLYVRWCWFDAKTYMGTKQLPLWKQCRAFHLPSHARQKSELHSLQHFHRQLSQTCNPRSKPRKINIIPKQNFKTNINVKKLQLRNSLLSIIVGERRSRNGESSPVTCVTSRRNLRNLINWTRLRTP